MGAYAAGSGRLSDAYELFLMALVVSADPVQKQKIEVQQDVCQDVRNQMQRALQNAREAYASDPSVVDNVPDFGSWLTDPLSLGYSCNTGITGYRS